MSYKHLLKMVFTQFERLFLLQRRAFSSSKIKLGYTIWKSFFLKKKKGWETKKQFM